MWYSHNLLKNYRNIFSFILETHIPERQAPDRVMNEIMKYLDQNFSKNILIEKLSRTIGLSSSRIQHIFKEYTGISIGKYILLERVRKSKMLISKKPLSSVASECGFYDQSQFHRYFKQYTGLTPQGYAHSRIDV